MTVPLTSSDQAATWLQPDQVEALRTACYDDRFRSTHWQRNETIVTVLYDTGLSVSELVQLDVDHLDLDTGTIQVPATGQSQTQTPASPSSAILELDQEHTLGTGRLLTSYLHYREDNSAVLFPSRNGGRLTPKAIRDLVTKTAECTEIRPYTPTGRGDPADISPQTLRHSTAWRLLTDENRSLSEVRDRLRHTALTTTRSLYAPFTRDGDHQNAIDSPSRTSRKTLPEREILGDMLDAVPDILFAFDMDGQMLWWNTRVTAVTGYSDAEITNMYPLDFVAPADKEQIAEAIARVINQEAIERQEAHLVTKDDDYLPYEFTGAPLTDDDGSVWGIAGVGRDVSTRERFERISDGFYTLDTDWRFTSLNSQAEALVGRSEEALLGTVVWEAFPGAAELQVYDEFHTAMETQDSVSFDQYYPPLDTWFDVRAYPSKTGLSVYLRDITDRKEREQELEQQRTALTQLDQFNTLVHDLVHAVVEESTRTEIEQTVCDQLAASEFYQAAWIGEQTRSAAEITPRAGGGIDLDAASNTTTVTDVNSTQGIAQRAAESRDVCVGQTRSDEPVRTADLEQHEAVVIGSALAVPIEYDDALYGVLVVYATDSAAFDERQQASFADLGEAIGFAIAAAERKEALVAESALELTLSIRDPNQFFIQAATRFDATVTLEGITGRTDDAYLEYFTVTGISPAEIRDLADQSGMVDHVRVVSSHDTECLCEVGVTDSSITTAVAEYGGTVTAMTAEDESGTVRIDLPRTADVRRVIDALEATVADVELQAKETVDRPLQTQHRFQAAVTDRLTEKQRDALEAAYLAGFFEQPRDSTGEDIAGAMGISPSTFHQHLWVGLRKLVGPIAESSTAPS